jgi:hypothetical protein
VTALEELVKNVYIVFHVERHLGVEVGGNKYLGGLFRVGSQPEDHPICELGLHLDVPEQEGLDGRLEAEQIERGVGVLIVVGKVTLPVALLVEGSLQEFGLDGFKLGGLCQQQKTFIVIFLGGDVLDICQNCFEEAALDVGHHLLKSYFAKILVRMVDARKDVIEFLYGFMVEFSSKGVPQIPMETHYLLLVSDERGLVFKNSGRREL